MAVVTNTPSCPSVHRQMDGYNAARPADDQNVGTTETKKSGHLLFNQMDVGQNGRPIKPTDVSLV